MRMWIQKKLKCVFCIKQSRTERIIQKTKKRLSKELDIVNFVKLVREVKTFINCSLSYEERRRLLKPSRICYVNSAGENADDTDITHGE